MRDENPEGGRDGYGDFSFFTRFVARCWEKVRREFSGLSDAGDVKVCLPVYPVCVYMYVYSSVHVSFCVDVCYVYVHMWEGEGERERKRK